MARRIREAMKTGGLVPPASMGGKGKIVEADEPYFKRGTSRNNWASVALGSAYVASVAVFPWISALILREG